MGRRGAVMGIIVSMACAPADRRVAGPAPPPAARASPAPTDPALPPFTVEELRAAMPVGLELRHQLEVAGGMKRILVRRVAAVDASSVTVNGQLLGEDGVERTSMKATTMPWERVMGPVGTGPAVVKTRRESSIETPAGRFDTIEYGLQLDDVTITIHFARALPGPPVYVLEQRNGALLSRMTLLSRTGPVTPGASPTP